jgi:hypothetical protein
MAKEDEREPMVRYRPEPGEGDGLVLDGEDGGVRGGIARLDEVGGWL